MNPYEAILKALCDASNAAQELDPQTPSDQARCKRLDAVIDEATGIIFYMQERDEQALAGDRGDL
jgi:hypothetical protein